MVANEVVVESRIAAAMGAKISVTGPGRSMYLVIGRSTLLESLVNMVGGEAILRLTAQKMLATFPFAGYLALRGNYQISHIGPVTVDIKRLAKLSEALAKAKLTGPGNP